jgi:hypothetical protein
VHFLKVDETHEVGARALFHRGIGSRPHRYDTVGCRAEVQAGAISSGEGYVLSARRRFVNQVGGSPDAVAQGLDIVDTERGTWGEG